MARFCPECGTRRVDEAPFCEQCGHAFAAPEAAPADAISPSPLADEPADASSTAVDPSEQTGKGRGSRRGLVIGAAAAALALGGAALWWTGVVEFPGLGGATSQPGAAVDVALMPVGFGERCGFVDHEGRMVINPQYESASFFLADSGLAAVRMGGKWGLIDRQGAFVVNPQFDGLEPIPSTELFVAQQGQRAGIVDARGTFVVNPQFDYIGAFDAEGRAFAGTGGRHGLIDVHGNFLIPPQFESISAAYMPDGSVDHFPQGLAAAQLGGRWGYIDSRGNWAITPQFAEARPFDASGLAAVKIGTATAVVNRNPNDMAVDMDGTPGGASLRAGWGYIDRNGRLAIAPQFDHAGQFSEVGLAPVALGDLYGYIDRTGAIKINPQFTAALPFVQGSTGWIGVVQVSHGRDAAGQQRWGWGIIDQAGAFKVQPQLEGLDGFDRNRRSIVRVGNLSGLVDETGRMVVNPIYSRLYLMPGSPHYFYEKPATAGQGSSEIGWIAGDGQILTTVRGSVCGGEGD